MTEREWANYYKAALETTLKMLDRPLDSGENFSLRRAMLKGYLRGVLGEVEKEKA